MATTDTLLDANVLLDIFTEDASWLAWSENALATASEEGELVVNPIVYAEVSLHFSTIEDLDDALPYADYRRDAIPWEASFLAGRAFLAYRRQGGRRRSPLPDFFIGAHAAVKGIRLLTRDASRYRRYFPRVTLICP